MHSNSNGQPIWLVHIEWPRATELLVPADTQAEAEATALERVEGREAVAWASVGDPIVVNARPHTEATEGTPVDEAAKAVA